MHLINIDDIGPQSLEGILDLLMNARPARATERLAVLPVETDLGGDQGAFAPPAFGQRLADDLL
jgi:hypothetical protein